MSRKQQTTPELCTYLQRRAGFQEGQPVEEIVLCLVVLNSFFLPELLKALDWSLAARSRTLEVSCLASGGRQAGR